MIGDFLARNTGPLVKSTLASGLSAGAAVLLLAEINRVISDVNGHDPQRLLLILAEIVALFALGFYSQRVFNRIGQNITFDLRTDIVRRFLHAPVEQLEFFGRHKLLSTIEHDMSMVAVSLSRFPMIVHNVFVVLAASVYLAWLSAAFFAVTAVCLLSSVLLMIWLTGRLRRHLNHVNTQYDKLSAHFQKLFDARYELKLNRFRRSRFFEHHYLAAEEAFRQYRIRSDDLWSVALGISNALVPLILVILLAAHYTVLPQQGAVLVGYVTTMLFIRGPIRNLFDQYNLMLAANASRKRIDEVTRAAGDGGPSQERRPAAWKVIEYRDITYRYRQRDGDDAGAGDAFALGPLSLSVNAGEVLLITGGNGSGKSTLAKIMAGAYPPASGDIAIDGTVVPRQHGEWFRGHVSAIFQDFALFDEVLDDIGGLVTDQPKIAALLRELDLTGSVSAEGSRLVSRGLSAGQARRLALLFTLFENREMLIFDEWAAGQDSSNRERFYSQLIPRLKQLGKGIVLVSHDERFFAVADRIVTLENGVLVADARPA